jgi:hypothetical protein
MGKIPGRGHGAAARRRPLHVGGAAPSPTRSATRSARSAIARWVGSVDRTRLAQVLDGAADPEDLHGLYESPAAQPRREAATVEADGARAGVPA